jgi:dipeptidase D
MDSRMDEMEYVARRLAAVLNLDLDVNGRYSGWPMKAESRLAEDFMTVAMEVLGDTCRPCICAIHAGLECGIICSAVEGLDAISIGPELKGIHAPGEALELGSMERLYQIVCELLKR